MGLKRSMIDSADLFFVNRGGELKDFKDKSSILCITGLCCMTACSIYAHRITTDFFDPLFVAQK